MKPGHRNFLILAAIILSMAIANLSSEEEDSKSPEVAQSGEIKPISFFEDDKHLDKTPPRTETGLVFKKLDWDYACMECHKHVDDPTDFQREMEVEHDNIVLEHGNNRYCLNCHHDTQRDQYVDYDGAIIAKENHTLLCAKCHGPKHRDWKAGVHGRQNGYWDESKGPKVKLNCIQCHDPHKPTFAPIKPMPPLHYPKRAPKPDTDGSHDH